MRSNMNFKGYEDSNNNNKPPPANPNPNPTQLLSQPSIYSLTFDEFQNTMGGLGKDFGSMNMDELLKNIWTAEETQSLNVPSSSANNGVEASNSNNINNNYYYSYYGNLNGNLQRQGSLTLPRTLSQKTVDEVWRDLMMKESSGGANNGTKDNNNGGVVASASASASSAMPQRQQTLGEMTLEEFLVRAGVVRDDNNSNSNIRNNNNNVPPLQIGKPGPGQWFNNENTGLMMGFQQQPNGNMSMNMNMNMNMNMGNNTNPMVNSNNPVSKQQPPTLALSAGNHTQQHSQQQQQPPLFPKPANVAFAAAPMNLMGGSHNQIGGGGLAAAAAPTTQVSPAAVPYVISRPRKCGATERVVERRQRRMIKNRESAARSRARKQAYTLELEAEVDKLKELNRELKKKQANILELHKDNSQAVVTLNGAWGGKRLCLRRTLTGPW